MIKRLSESMQRISQGWMVLATLALMVVFITFVLPAQSQTAQQATGSNQSPDTSLGSSPDELYRMAEEYGETGRQAYIQARWTFDFIFPLVYTTFLACGISWFSGHFLTLKGIWKLANLLPLLGGLFDYLENGAASLLMGLYPHRLAGLPVFLIGANLMKWLLIGMSFLVYAGYAAGALVSCLKPRGANRQ
jgi:hypothetical protein